MSAVHFITLPAGCQLRSVTVREIPLREYLFVCRSTVDRLLRFALVRAAVTQVDDENTRVTQRWWSKLDERTQQALFDAYRSVNLRYERR